MKLRFWKTDRIREMNRRLANLEKMTEQGLREDAIDEANDRLARLERMWAPPESSNSNAAKVPSGILPQYATIWQRIPGHYQSIANSAVKWLCGFTLEDALKDPSGQKLATVMQKAGPIIDRIGGLDKLMGFLPQDLKTPSAGSYQQSPDKPTLTDPYYRPPE